MENLDKIMDDPLKFFDYLNQKVWKDQKDEKIQKIISNSRERIVAEKNRADQYLLVGAYMLVLRETAMGDAQEFLDRTITKIKRGY